MSVHNGRRHRQLLPTAMAFNQFSKQTVVKPVASFEKASLLSLGGIVMGTTIVTTGILFKQIELIIVGFSGMALIVLCMIRYS
jgi:hypothetical protein